MPDASQEHNNNNNNNNHKKNKNNNKQTTTTTTTTTTRIPIMKDYLVLITSDHEDDEIASRGSSSSSSSSSSIDELLKWTQEHVSLLATSTTTLLVKTKDIADRIIEEVVLPGNEDSSSNNKNKKNNKNHFASWKLDIDFLVPDNEEQNNDIDSSGNKLWDLLLVNKVLSLTSRTSSHTIVGVFFFPGRRGSLSPTALENIVRICQYPNPNIPLALNRSTATLCVKSLFHTRVAYVIFNPAAGQRPPEEDMAAIKKILEPSMRLKICYTEKDRSIADQCTEIVKMLQQEKQQQEDRQECEKSSPSIEKSIIPDRESIIIASGGDGTVSAIAGATLNSGIPVGIIPRGTANAFSVALGIPTDFVEEACHNILRGNVRDVDGALLSAELLWHTSLLDEDDLRNELKDDDDDVDDSQNNFHPHIPRTTPWINHAGLGFEAGLVDNATRQLKDKFGNLAYTIGAAQQVLQNEQFRCTFIVDDDESTEKTVETNIITIANVDASSSIFAQGFGTVIPNDGLFEVTIGTATGLDEIRQLATLVANALVKNNLGSDTILSFRCKKIKVTCDPPQKLLVDGEVIRDMDTITFTCVPKGLKVFAPSPPENS